MFRILKPLLQPQLQFDPNISRYRFFIPTLKLARALSSSKSHHCIASTYPNVHPHLTSGTGPRNLTARINVYNALIQASNSPPLPIATIHRNFFSNTKTKTTMSNEHNETIQKPEVATTTDVPANTNTSTENKPLDSQKTADHGDDQSKEETKATNNDSGNKHSNNQKRKRTGAKRKWGETKWTKEKTKNKRNNNPKAWAMRNAERDAVHPGSFANPSMRELFGITLPAHLELDTDTGATHDGGDDDANVKNGQGDAKGDKPSEVAAPPAAADATTTTSTDGTITTSNDANQSTDENEAVKLPKRKVAILVQFLGTKYSGMQINEGKNTIQAQIELAIYKAGLMAKTNFGFPKKYSWSNSARTDKGVHSCAQVCSVKIIVPTDNLDKIRELINEQFPDDIRVADVIKVPKGFCARTQRDKVRYQYMLPSFVLQSSEQLREIFESVLGADRKSRNMKNPFTEEEKLALQQKFNDYRATDENINNLKSALQTYEGTKNYHNYTSGKKWDDPSAQRYIISFKVQDRVVDKYGVEWIPTLVLGQSFLLHQIRKMICHAMDAARNSSSIKTMNESFRDKYMNINTAPAQGLFLDMSYFDNFNNRKQMASEPLDWHSDENTAAAQRWKKFKEDNVMGHIMDEEKLQGNFVGYIYQQEHHNSFNNYEAVDEKKVTDRN